MMNNWLTITLSLVALLSWSHGDSLSENTSKDTNRSSKSSVEVITSNADDRFTSYETFPTPNEFRDQEMETFVVGFWKELLKEWFEEKDLAEIIDMFLWCQNIDDVNDVKDDVEEDYWKRIKLDSKVILYYAPSFSHYEEKVLKFVENAKWKEILALADKIEKSTKSKKYLVFVATLKKLGNIYISIAEWRARNAELDKSIAEWRARNAEWRKQLNALKQVLSNLSKLDK